MLATSEKRAHRVVQRRLPVTADPFALFSASGASRRPDTMLFEARLGVTLLMTKAALRIECRGEVVTAEALSANGQSLLAALAARSESHLIDSEPGRLTLRFDRSDSSDAEVRLFAPAPLHVIRSILEMELSSIDDAFALTAIGIVAFDYAALGEDVADNAEDPIGFPDFLFWVPESLIVIEPGSGARLLCAAFSDAHERRSEHNLNDAAVRLGELWDRCSGAPSSAPTPVQGCKDVKVSVDSDDSTFMAVVEQAKGAIAAGEVYQIVPSRTFSARCNDPLAAFAALRQLEPTSYRFFVNGADFILLGASPETSVRTYAEGQSRMVEVRPIAGTRPRGRTPDEDDRFEADLRLDQKEVAEHMMLVDLARNDVARISVPGTRHVAQLMLVERFARVMHLVSSVTGRLATHFDAIDALATCLNVGTLTGAPKLRATQLLRSFERTKRGPYGGAIGWLNGAGEMDTAVVIRSAFVRDGIASVRAGAGVVYDSDPRAEAEETRRKAAALLSILSADDSESRP